MNQTPTKTFKNATGKIDYTMTNDYMFRAVLQENKKVLTGLICSLLHLKRSDVKTILILNPIELVQHCANNSEYSTCYLHQSCVVVSQQCHRIASFLRLVLSQISGTVFHCYLGNAVLGKAIDDKAYVLDIKILLNNALVINLEMQVLRQDFWTDRSLLYLCRAFDNLEKGNDYTAIKPAYHIGILDFTPFPKYPEFYATNKILNVKKHYIYNDKFTLHVLDLNQIHQATKQDKAHGAVRYWCEAREEGERIMLTYKNMLAEKDSELAEKNNKLAEKDSELATLQAQVASLQAS